MKKLVFLLLTCVCSLQLMAQREANFNTIDRKAGLFNNQYKNSFSGSLTYGILHFKGDLSNITDQSTTKNITLNKRINNSLSLCTKVSFGELFGSGEVYNRQYNLTTNSHFKNSFLAYGILVKKQINTELEPNSMGFKINIASGLGIIASEVHLRSEYFTIPDEQLNSKKIFIPFTLDFEYFFTPNFGLTAATELNYCFNDKLDLSGVNLTVFTLTKMDIFTGYTAGICIKLK